MLAESFHVLELIGVAAPLMVVRFPKTAKGTDFSGKNRANRQNDHEIKDYTLYVWFHDILLRVAIANETMTAPPMVYEVLHRRKDLTPLTEFSSRSSP